MHPLNNLLVTHLAKLHKAALYSSKWRVHEASARTKLKSTTETQSTTLISCLQGRVNTKRQEREILVSPKWKNETPVPEISPSEKSIF